MESRIFLRKLPEAIGPRVPHELGELRQAWRWSLVQLWYGNPALHYECWLRRRLAAIEIGLHFEADPLTNARLLGSFRRRERAIRGALGPETRIEEWDRGWARIWEEIPYESLDGALQARLAARLARYVTVLEPILRDELPADVAWRPALRRRRSSGAPTRVRAARGAAAPRA